MNLAEGIDVAENENRIAEYQKANYQEILENQAHQVYIGPCCCCRSAATALPQFARHALSWQASMAHGSFHQDGHSSIKFPAAINYTPGSYDQCIVVLWTPPWQDSSTRASSFTKPAKSLSHLHVSQNVFARQAIGTCSWRRLAFRQHLEQTTVDELLAHSAAF